MLSYLVDNVQLLIIFSLGRNSTFGWRFWLTSCPETTYDVPCSWTHSWNWESHQTTKTRIENVHFAHQNEKTSRSNNLFMKLLVFLVLSYTIITFINILNFFLLVFDLTSKRWILVENISSFFSQWFLNSELFLI